jgi:uncharacterized protein YciI
MKFVIIGFDGPEGEAKRKIYRPAHLANMEPLDQAGRVVLAGPLTDKTGSLIVIEADSLEEAERFAREDPYTSTAYSNGSKSILSPRSSQNLPYRPSNSASYDIPAPHDRRVAEPMDQRYS